MKQITKEQAIKIAESGLWKDWSNDEIVKFQLYQNRLAMPYPVFMDALCDVLGRGVYTHELAGYEGKQRLIDEYEGTRPAPTIEDIISMIPEDKRMLIL